MSINQQKKEQTNLSENNIILASNNFQSKNLPQNNNNLEQNIELINNLNSFFNTSSNIPKINEYLCTLINWSNSSSFTYALLNPVNFHLKLFSSNALLHLFTNNYTEIEVEKAQNIFDSLLNYLFHNSLLLDLNR